MKTIFVYGTLRFGGLLKDEKAQYKSKGFIKGLLYVGNDGSPRTIQGDGKVVGEIYAVKEEVFRKLNEFEKDYGYIARQVIVYPSERKVWVWFDARHIPAIYRLLLQDGDYLAYYRLPDKKKRQMWKKRGIRKGG